MGDTRDLMERVEDIVNDLLLISDTFDKGVSSMDSMIDAIDGMRLSDSDKKEIAKFMVKFALNLISDVVSKLDEIKEDLEDVKRELDATG